MTHKPKPRWCIVTPGGKQLTETMGEPGCRRRDVVHRFIRAASTDPLANFADYYKLGWRCVDTAKEDKA